MSYELQKIVAFVLKTQGLKEISEADFVNYLSLSKRMLAPADAKKLLEKCLASGVLVRDGNLLKPTFPLEDIVVEPGFTIKSEVLKAEKKEVFMEVVQYLCDKTGKDKKDVVREINKTAEETCTLPVVAALIYAKMLGIDASRFYQSVEREILGEKEEG